MEEETKLDQQNEEELEDEIEVSLTDKIVGVFTEPASLFSNIKLAGAKTSDWLIPLFLMMLLSFAVQFVVLQNPVLKQQAIDEQIERTKEFLDGYVESGQMTQEQADQQLEAAYDRMEEQMSAGLVISAVTIIVLGFIFFFVISGVYILIVKFVLKGDGSYKEGLSAYGLPGYIMALQLIATIILVLFTESIKAGPDVAKLMNMDPQTITGYVMGYLDPFKIWYYVVLGIAFAKMFKSDKSAKYIVTVISVWVIFGLLFWALAQAVPFLKFMIR